MAISPSQRDLEDDYLSLSHQVEALLQRKIAAYGLQAELEATHQQMMELARQLPDASDSRALECDYLNAAKRVQELLQQKAKSYRLDFELEALQQRMRKAAIRLGWSQGAEERPATSPRVKDTEKPQDFAALQERILSLESGICSAIGLIQSSEKVIADLTSLKDRFLHLESGLERILRAVDLLEQPREFVGIAAEREAAAGVLSSLTKLVQGMRAADSERQIHLASLQG
jgi:hypothetical protein